MAETKQEFVTGWVVDEYTEVTIDDLTRFCSVRREKIVELVSEGIIEPVDRTDQRMALSKRLPVARRPRGQARKRS